MFFKEFILDKYVAAFENITVKVALTSMEYIGHLVEQGWCKDYWVDLMNKQSPFYVAKSADIKHIIDSKLPNRSIIQEGSLNILVLHLTGAFAEMCTQKEIEKLKMTYSADKVLGLLPHQIKGYKRHPRFVIDKILVDGQLLKATDLHIEPVSNLNGDSSYKVKYRLGIHLNEITQEVNLTEQEVQDIIYDCIANRSRSSNKASDALTDTPVVFRLVDPMYPTRCQVLPSQFGPVLVIRFFDFKKPLRIPNLGFDKQTEEDLDYDATLVNGLTLVSGGIGSGKGTTINAMALKISETGKFSMISVDSPIEYLGNFPQVEYQSQPQLYGIMNSLKKMDLNICLLNEIATQETAREVLNLVVSGVHVMTTIHSTRVYNIFYKLHEQLGELYTSLVPYLNYVSYQDKFSITCKNCQETLHKLNYDSKPNHKRLLEFFNINQIKQPRGCSNCKNGIDPTGIQVVSEGIFFNDKLKFKLVRVDLHEQSELLKTELYKRTNNLEQILKDKLLAGDILMDEILQKLDTWR